MTQYGCLYLITGPSGKLYIGITAQKLKARWRAHRAHAKRADGYLQRAILKHGAQKFTCSPLVYANDYEYLKSLERAAIVQFNTKYPRGYNMTDGGDGVLGVIVTEEGRLRRRAAQQRSFADSERRERHRQSQRGEELRRQRSECQRAKWADPEYRLKAEVSIRKRLSDPVVRRKMADARRGPRINDGLTKSQRYRLKDLESYRKKKREYAKTESQRIKRAEYALKYRERMKEKATKQCL